MWVGPGAPRSLGPTLSARTDTSTQPRTHISASLGSRTIHPVLYSCQNSGCTRSFHTPGHNTDAVQPRQALIHAPSVALSECKYQMCSDTSDQAHSPKQNKRTLTPTTPPQTPGQPAGHGSWPQGPVHMGCTALCDTTLGLSPQAQEAHTSYLELKPHSSYVWDQNLQAPWVVLKLVSSSFFLQHVGKMAAAVMSGSCHQNIPAEEGEECMENM